MRKIENIQELHGILLDIAKEFDKVCRENNIPYYMLGGTMLGAVRHSGFIPWDDDMDFGIPRAYYDRFLDIAPKYLPESYRILTIDNTERIIYGFAKMEDTSTVIKEIYMKESIKPVGVHIDIFPLDFTNNNFGIFSRNKIITYLLGFQAYRFLSIRERSLMKKVIAMLIKVVLFPLDKKTIIRYIRQHLVDSSGPNLANHFGAWGIREIVPCGYMGNPQLFQFENIQLYGVAEADNYLTSLYGDWRKLPPLEKQKHHMYEAYKFE